MRQSLFLECLRDFFKSFLKFMLVVGMIIYLIRFVVADIRENARPQNSGVPGEGKEFYEIEEDDGNQIEEKDIFQKLRDGKGKLIVCQIPSRRRRA
jgi:hypothetical protein